MQIVIDIPEGIYKAAQAINVKYDDVVQIPLEVIANGTVLKTASWEKFGNGKSWACTNCRRGVMSREKYCPECGSLMNRG